VPGYRALHLALDFVRGREQRNSALLRLRDQAGLFQPFGTTREDRYPGIFSFLQDALGADSDLRLLSFGCSTGEEVRSLARRFPNATIKGLDISPERIAQCRASCVDDRTTFEVADTTAAEGDARYDVVFAMAVFRDPRLGKRKADDRRIRAFAKFELAVADLARTVKPGGYLALRHANFNFTDTAASNGFDRVQQAPNKTAKFDRAGKPLLAQGMEGTVFRKR
jgi:SAM-dependent methyltransferase